MMEQYEKHPKAHPDDMSQRLGKSTIIASTEGNQSVPGHEETKIVLNIYAK